MPGIRRFKREDLKATVELIHTTIKLCYPWIYPLEVIDFFLKYHSPEQILKKASEGKMFLIVDIEKIIGTGYLVGDEIGGIYILPDEQKKGYGRKMMDHLLGVAKNNGLKRIWLDATPFAKPLYDNMNFDLVKKARDLVGDKPLDYYVMEKYL